VIYTKTITEAFGGSAANPTHRDMYVTTGLIYQFELYFPPGSSGLVGVAVLDGGYQVWPSEPGEWFFGDNALISFPDRYFISSPRKALIIASYNLDDTYAHLFQIRIGQVSTELFISSFLPGVGMDKMADTIAAALAGQEAEKIAQRDTLVSYFSGGGTVQSAAGESK